MVVFATVPTVVIFFPLIIMTELRTGGDPVPSMSVPPTMAIGCWAGENETTNISAKSIFTASCTPSSCDGRFLFEQVKLFLHFFRFVVQECAPASANVDELSHNAHGNFFGCYRADLDSDRCMNTTQHFDGHSPINQMLERRNYFPLAADHADIFRRRTECLFKKLL